MVRFDKPCRLIRGAVTYFRDHMAVSDYLTESGSAQMTWVGEGAAWLGLTGVCRREDFERLCRGLHPGTGEKLMVRDKGARRRVCFFGQISPPKDVSIACLVGGDTRIAGWWDQAVQETLREIEATVHTRVRRHRLAEDRRTACMVAAVVTHDTNRALDPQLHTHVCVMNLTYDREEGRWKGVQPSGLYRHQGYFREVCYNKLAERFRSGGYVVQPAPGMGFQIVGMPDELRVIFSKRRREILRQAALSGAQTQDELQAITSRSRAAKTKATAEGLRARWINECGDAFAALKLLIAESNRKIPSAPETSPARALASTEAHLFERSSAVDERVLLREALAIARGEVSLSELRSALRIRIETGALLQRGELLVSRDALQAENEFVAWANAQGSNKTPLGSLGGKAGLAADQVRAASEILRSTSVVTVFQGDAGTGKTTCLQQVITGSQRTGYGVFCCAPSAAATDVLRQELGADAATLQQLLVSPKLQAEVRDRLLIVDEAGLISVGAMRDLCRLADRQKLRLLLVGDTKQHTAVEAGDALRCLQKYTQVPKVRLTEIRRQRNAHYRQAVSLLAQSKAGAALDHFSRLGAMREVSDFPTLLRRAAADYVAAVRAGQSCLVISPVWAEIHAFNAEARSQLKAEGRLGAEDRLVETTCSLKWTREQRRRPENYQPGDRITFFQSSAGFAKDETVRVLRREGGRLMVHRLHAEREIPLDIVRSSGFDVGISRTIEVAVGDCLLIRANHREAKLNNGEIVEVAAWTADGGIHLTDGRVMPPGFSHYGLGYATTSHGAQGKTVDRGILLMGPEGIAAGNIKQAYVANSRFRETQVIYTTDRLAAREAMQRPADRLLAKEAMDRSGPNPKLDSIPLGKALPPPNTIWEIHSSPSSLSRMHRTHT